MASQTPEQIGREAGKAIADAISDGIEGILLKMADKIAQLQAEQAEIRDGMLALSNRIEAVSRATRAAEGRPSVSELDG